MKIGMLCIILLSFQFLVAQDEIILYNSKHHFDGMKEIIKDSVVPFASDQGLCELVNKIKPDTFVYLANKKLVGFCEHTFESSETGGIEFLGVLSNYRNEGYGSQLLQRTLDSMKAKNIQLVELHVDSFNQSAIYLYQKFGFKQSGSYENRCITMVKLLDKNL